MPKPEAAPATPSPRLLRAIIWLALLLTVALLATLGSAHTATAASLPAALPAFEEEEECELGEPDCVEELGFEECEEAEDGEELECEEEPEPLRAGEAPADCLLTSARPRVSIAGGQGRLKLDVRYEVSAPAQVSVSLRSAGGKGTVAMPPERLRLSRGGVFHESLQLTDEETERALSAREFSVRLRVADVPASCRRYELQRLTVKRGGEESPVFSAPKAS
jgi:hypothetical protein